MKSGSRTSWLSSSVETDVAVRLAVLQEQVQATQKMVAEDRASAEILRQLFAARTTMAQIERRLRAEYLLQALTHGSPTSLDELTTTFTRGGT